MSRRSDARSPTGAAIGIVLAAALMNALTVSPAQAQGNKLCALLTPAEIEAALGFKVALSPNALGGCMGPTPSRHMVSIELKAAPIPGPDGQAQIVQAMKAHGIRMEFATFGPVTCSTGIPQKPELPFGTNCSISKGGQTAIISVTAGSEREMVPLEKLRTLAEKMAPRL